MASDHLAHTQLINFSAAVIVAWDGTNIPWEELRSRDVQVRVLTVFITWVGLRFLQSLIKVGFNGVSFSGAVFNLLTKTVGIGIMAPLATVKQLGLLPGLAMIKMKILIIKREFYCIPRYEINEGKATALDIVLEDSRGRCTGVSIHTPSIQVYDNLQSSNVLLGPNLAACLTNYCLAVLADTTVSDDDVNFARYKAPEMCKSIRQATPKSNVYTFGVLLLELLMGKPPSQHPFLTLMELHMWVKSMRDEDIGEENRLAMLKELAVTCHQTSLE
ncbi:hypothetical protein NE237_002579 [Protea cynaroides]|uniref:Protein kinase domain-containing protein n=1 Tax=Protea cynaroides TaxID=273540 RepID=A0A9Q0QZ71_9MAGN|nr:hypothetical protein NE237_002579 [Protea cynaroides]